MNKEFTIFDHELGAYSKEIEQLKEAYDSEWKHRINDPEFNLTHFTLGISNRGNMILVGLCSLVEVRLADIAQECEQNSIFKIDDIKGQGIAKLKLFLSRCGTVDFAHLKYWAEFTNLNRIRNAIVHGYGGIIPVKDTSKLKSSMKKLNMEDALVGGRRIRLNTSHLKNCHQITSKLIDELRS